MGRTARGVRGISLSRDDSVVDMIVVQPGMSVLTVCENGYGKRTPVEDYRLTRRGSKGVINIRVTERNGAVVALRGVTHDYSLMLITTKGILMRMPLDELREIGRATQGVRLIRVDEGDRVVAVAKIAGEKEEQEIDEAAASTEEADGAASPPPEPAAETPENPDSHPQDA